MIAVYLLAGIAIVMLTLSLRRRTAYVQFPSGMIALNSQAPPRHEITFDQLPRAIQALLEGERFDCLIVSPGEGDEEGFSVSHEDGQIEFAAVFYPAQQSQEEKFKQVAGRFGVLSEENQRLGDEKDVAYLVKPNQAAVLEATRALLIEVYGLAPTATFGVSAMHLASQSNKLLGFSTEPHRDLLAGFF